ncbi:DUF397 domain-containing protein [Nocardia uniformis]|uniref:DUF397 domain-containing protein n=1 Tax=Nocardia uniformis TaxID=53432 RepID=A0A849C1I1_9NOCA|nr:DUF397 domain-containing protein [Nocardia uniformis]NNH72474.1 DUF397 domain-containing protein [Nocardia uniformis]
MNVRETARTKPSGWFKSTFSDHGNACVEVRFGDGEILIRDSKYDGDEAVRPIVVVSTQTWGVFLEIVTGTDESDDTRLGIPAIQHDIATGVTTLRDAVGTALSYTREEWAAFTAGIHAGEFALASA